MSEIDHFAYGFLTPVLACAMSCVGSWLGLQCAARARFAGRTRAGWLGLAAVAIGGTGIWVMHFIAMLGFRVSGMEIRYDVDRTLQSAVVAIACVGVGVFLVGYGKGSPGALLKGGLITGLGLASMHYLGVAALRMNGQVSYNWLIVGASVLAAVLAATLALWFTVQVRGHWVTAGAAVVLGLAFNVMHYIGMAAIQVGEDPNAGPPSGASGFDVLLPLLIGISVFAMLLLVTLGLSLTEHEIALEQQFEQQLRALDRQRETGRPPRDALSPPESLQSLSGRPSPWR